MELIISILELSHVCQFVFLFVFIHAYLSNGLTEMDADFTFFAV